MVQAMDNPVRFALVIPPGGYFAERWRDGRGMPELGILSVAAMLEQEGIAVTIVACHLYDMDFPQLRERLSELKPDIVGVTATTENRFQSFEVLRQARLALPAAFTVIGGPHVTNTADDTLKHLSFIDGVARGEGELTAVELARTLADKGDLHQVNGLSFRHEGRIVHNPPRLPIADLDTLPFPARHLVEYDRYNFYVEVPGRGRLKAANLMTSRGCPFNCNFCATPANWGRKVRTISPERVLQEIDLVYNRYEARAIWFYDDTFNLSKKRVQQICQGILDRKLDISWFCEVRLDLLDRPTLALMKQAGCFHIGFGIEAGAERIRREVVGKDFDIEQARQVITWCNELDIVANPFFVVSHPEETAADLEKTRALIEEFADRTQESISILHIYPGTQLERLARERGMLPDDFTWTRKHDSRIITLPAAQGEVPLFLDKLSWWQIGKIMFIWSKKQGYSLGNKVPSVLKNIRSWKDIYRYSILFLCFLRYRMAPRAVRAIRKLISTRSRD